jgi:hypothetical protein
MWMIFLQVRRAQLMTVYVYVCVVCVCVCVCVCMETAAAGLISVVASLPSALYCI